MADNIALRLAHECVHEYADESNELVRQHIEAMECRSCEDFLQKGILAFKFLSYAEEVMREADYRGIENFSGELRDAIRLLYEAWLRPCDVAQKWIESLREREYVPENLTVFREACDQVRDILERADWQSRADRSRALSSSDEPW